jgi:HEAT repeats
MSLAILTQVYDETRRLAVAGSVAAAGDFRLKKLVAPLEQTGAKAPVFARVAQAVQALVGAREQDSADALLELATLVSAVLYTQGETGAAGTLEPIETVELPLPSTQTSARVLKPLMDALTATGGGVYLTGPARLELIRDAHGQGAFHDIHLVQPSLQALDDNCAELANFVAAEVFPLYGRAVLPDLRAKYDPKGKAGDARRLRLLYALDPAGAGDLVAAALDDGSKEVKVAAISCLGGRPEDVRYLLEQTTAKAAEVRRAAYRALADIDESDAVAALEKALDGKDLDLAADALAASRSDRLVRSVLVAAERDLTALPKLKDKKEANERLARLRSLANTLAGRPGDAEAFLLKVFEARAALAKVKGEPVSGVDVNSSIVKLLANGTAKQQRALAAAHASLPPDDLALSFHAARRAIPASEVFTMFSPYLVAKVDEKKEQRDPAWVRREVLCAAIAGHNRYYFRRDSEGKQLLDPRWLDAAVGLGRLDLIAALARPGHDATDRYLTREFDAVLKGSKMLPACYDVVATMARASHPEATGAFVAAVEKHAGKADYASYWFLRLILELPREALPRLEALVPKLQDRIADTFVANLEQLRQKTSL